MLVLGIYDQLFADAPPTAFEQSKAALALVRCPPPSQIFQGRQDILQKMNEYFSRDIGERHIYVLHGLGGSGKTQIALKFLDITNRCENPRYILPHKVYFVADDCLTQIYKTIFHQCQLSPNCSYCLKEYSYFSQNWDNLRRCITMADLPD
jgi:hypothetical protein